MKTHIGMKYIFTHPLTTQ